MKKNLGHCKYQNTLKDLEELDEILEWDTDAMFNLSDDNNIGRKNLAMLKNMKYII